MENLYDEVPYPGRPLSQAHVSRLATMGTLFGMRPADIRSARVLEVGCGDGGHLIPMALQLPDATFVGVDLAEGGIVCGNRTIEELGIRNITLRVQNLMDFSREDGGFDYVIAHGVYSWVPPPVRDGLLRLCREALTPNGIAFLSYNTHPGGHIRKLLREMMLIHAGGIADPLARAKEAIEVIRFVNEAQTEDSALGALLKPEMERYNRVALPYLLHDDLADIHEPCYFRDFAAHAASMGLQFLSESEFSSLQERRFSAAGRKQLDEYSQGDIIRREQYLDFVKCRRFRQTLLCRSEVALERSQAPQRTRDLFAASDLRSADAVDMASGVPMRFQDDGDNAVTVDHPLVKGMLLEIGDAWPCSLSFTEILSKARSRAGRSATDDEETISTVLWRTCGAGITMLDTIPWSVATRAGEKPKASPLARLQARGSGMITSLRHTSVHMEQELPRKFLTLLDGTRTREELREQLTETSGVVVTAGEIEENLQRFGRYALLLA